jgi:hypothetical protein
MYIWPAKEIMTYRAKCEGRKGEQERKAMRRAKNGHKRYKKWMRSVLRMPAVAAQYEQLKEFFAAERIRLRSEMVEASPLGPDHVLITVDMGDQ